MWLCASSIALDGWLNAILIRIVRGDVCIRDAICEHCCLMLYRLGYAIDESTNKRQSTIAKKRNEGTGAECNTFPLHPIHHPVCRTDVRGWG